MSQLPIPDASPKLREQIAGLVRQCLDTADEVRRAPLEARLDTLVYEAYGLDDADISVIEGQLSGSNSVESSEVVEDGDED